jgi:hypothetical protein
MTCFDKLALVSPKPRFTLSSENRWNLFTYLLFDTIIRIEKFIAELTRDTPPDGGLADAHKSD